MSYAICFLMLICLIPQAFALPVMNLNSPGAESITVFPDHKDKDLYYLAPVVMTTAKDENGIPVFSYMEYVHWLSTRAVVQTTMKPAFNQAEINRAKDQIRKVNPNAKFNALPFTRSLVIFGDILDPFIISSECDHAGGLIGDEQICSFNLNSKGRSVLRSMFRRGVALTMHLEYSIEGVIQQAEGTYKDASNTYRMAGRIGGSELAQYPQLFQDSLGRIINSWDD